MRCKSKFLQDEILLFHLHKTKYFEISKKLQKNDALFRSTCEENLKFVQKAS